MNPFAGLMTPSAAQPARAAAPKPQSPQVRRRRTFNRNPLGLTNGMCQALEALIETGTDELAAERLGLQPKTIAAQVFRAKERTGIEKRLLLVLAYDRWVREHREAEQ